MYTRGLFVYHVNAPPMSDLRRLHLLGISPIKVIISSFQLPTLFSPILTQLSIPFLFSQLPDFKSIEF